jgi:hypothetical protein
MAREELDRRDAERKRLEAEAREQRIRGVAEEILAERQHEEQREQRVADLAERILAAKLRGEELPPDPVPPEPSVPELNDVLGASKRK